MAIRTNSKKSGGVAWCPPAQEQCPTCGGLECLCRPRFFAGQLLTEADLNRLDRYITQKNKLRARHLHDWGTVCGLEVLCDPCGGNVRVTPGYALDRCGNDIVVCDEDTVDVCALITRCRDKDRNLLECRPWSDRGDCEDLEEEWILAIRYVETPSRGITPLRPSAGSCGCGNAGSCGCGPSRTCGCGNPGSCGCGPSQSVRTPRRNSPPQACEPTVVCETYTYEVYRKPVSDPKADGSALRIGGGPLIERFRCCLDALLEAIGTPPTDFAAAHYGASANAWYKWLCRARQGLLDYMTRRGGYRCERIARLSRIACPSPKDPNFATLFADVVDEFIEIFVEVVIDCFCAAMMPPCPPPTPDVRVPLACITVTGGQCRVTRVCNWTLERHYAMTMPNLRYWLSWLPITGPIRDMLHTLCCESSIDFDYDDDRKEYGRMKTLSQIGLSAAFDKTPWSNMAFAANLMGRNAVGEKQKATPEEVANPFHHVIARRMAAQLIEPSGGRPLVDLAGALFRGAAGSGTAVASEASATGAPPADGLAVEAASTEGPPAAPGILNARVAVLEKVVADQQRRIDQLLERLGDG